jgi:hypothetical protein
MVTTSHSFGWIILARGGAIHDNLLIDAKEMDVFSCGWDKMILCQP